RHLHALGLGDALDAVSVEPSALVFRHWDDGAVIASHPMGERYRQAFGAPYYGVHRVALRRVFAEALGPGVVHHDRRCVAVSQDEGEARLAFADGSSAGADVVVGADGVHSAVRAAVAGEVPPVY